jgi:hypothetical protein
MKKYEVYAKLTGKVYIGEYEARNCIEAAKMASDDLEKTEKMLESNLCVEGVEDVKLETWDSVEVE